jgi:hypothetical protein
MVFIPFGEVLESGMEPLFASNLVSFVFKGDKYPKEPLFLVAGCELGSSKTGEIGRH